MKALTLSLVFAGVLAAPLAAQSTCTEEGVVELQGAERAACFVELGWLQEAAWQHQAMGDRAAARELLARLEAVMRGAATSMGVLSAEGVSNLMATYRARFPGGVSGVFKPDFTDIGCMDCSAGHERAAFLMDTTLHIGMTPLTIIREMELPDGTMKEGSLQYFVNNSRQSSVHFSTTGDPIETEEFKPDILRLFDVFLGNTDRHQGNWLVRSTGEVAAIDHNRAFMHDNPYGVTNWRQQYCAIEDLDALDEYVERFAATPIDGYGPEFTSLLSPTRMAAFRAAWPEVVRVLTEREAC